MSEAAAIARATNGARSRYFWGLCSLLSVVVLWVSSSFLMNSMFTSMKYNKPFLITYLCTASFSMYLVRPAIAALRARGKPPSDSAPTTTTSRPMLGTRLRHGSIKSVDRIPGCEPIGSFTDADGTVYMRPDFSFRSRSHSRSISRPRLGINAARPVSVLSTDPPLTVRQTASLALAFCGLWFSANWSMNAALGYTSVSSTTILSSMSGFFTLAVGACVGVEQFTGGKVSSVLLSIVGVAIISKSDSSMETPVDDQGSTPKAPLVGDSLALISALAYAFYVILLKVRIRNESRVSMTLFFGFVGAWNIALIWPLGFVLHYTGIETWERPHGQMLWLSIFINAMITFVSDALYLRAMLMTSPLAVTLGISLTIPLAVAGDVARGTPVSWKTLLGGALVLGSFVANGLIDLAIAEEAIAEAIEDGELLGDDEGIETPPRERDRLLGSQREDDESEHVV